MWPKTSLCKELLGYDWELVQRHFDSNILRSVCKFGNYVYELLQQTDREFETLLRLLNEQIPTLKVIVKHSRTFLGMHSATVGTLLWVE